MKAAASSRSTVLWDERIRALCSEQGQFDRALRLLLHRDVQLHQQSDISLLRACHRRKTLSHAKLLHAHPLPHLRLPLHNSLVGEHLLLALAKCGAIGEALQVFQSLTSRMVRSWTALIAALVECGRSLEALRMHDCMQKEGVKPNKYTFVSFLKACSSPSLLDEGRVLHAEVCENCVDMDIFIITTLVSMYGKCGALAEAEDVFGSLLMHDVVLWNAMLSAYFEHKQGEKILLLYRQMQKEGVHPDRNTFLMALQPFCFLVGKGENACVGRVANTNTKALQIGRALHADARKRAIDSDVFVGTALVKMYAKCGAVREAEHAFMALGEYDAAAWNAMLSAYVENGQGHKALQLYYHMQKHNVMIDEATLTCVVQACIDIESVACREVHFVLVCVSLELNFVLAAALIHAYGGCASMKDARVVLNSLTNCDLVSWTACLAAYARLGDCTEGLNLFWLLIQQSIKPDGVLFGALLLTCSLGGHVNEGLDYMQFLEEECKLARDLNHYNLIADLFGRAGDFKRVESMLRTISTHTDSSFWLSLLGLCSIHGNSELGKVAFEHVLKSQSDEALPYILMTNIFRTHA